MKQKQLMMIFRHYHDENEALPAVLLSGWVVRGLWRENRTQHSIFVCLNKCMNYSHHHHTQYNLRH